jgi:hypothetical protein
MPVFQEAYSSEYDIPARKHILRCWQQVKGMLALDKNRVGI